MKITNKILLCFAFAFFLIIVGLISTTIFSTPDPQNDIKITQQMPESFDPIKSTQFNSANNITNSLTLANSKQGEVDIELDNLVSEDKWIIEIQDALGDPIPSGLVTYDNETKSFTNGSIIVPATSPKSIDLNVSADGYSSGAFTVTPNSPAIVLEYLCNFSILIEDKKGYPAPDTTIQVWKSNPPPRPLNYINVLSISNKRTFQLKRDGDECLVSWVSKPKHWFQSIDISKDDVYPKVGDLLFALDSSAWQIGYTPQHRHDPNTYYEIFPLTKQQSHRLKVWDSLSLGNRTETNHYEGMGIDHKLDILRDSQYQFCYIQLPNCKENQSPLYIDKTNDKGIWNLQGVPPALYYVQANSGDNLYSLRIPLHPACSGARLRMIGEGTLFVYALREGIPSKDKHYSRIMDAEINLVSEKGIKIYDKITIGDGGVRYNLPFGRYRLIVHALGQKFEHKITFNKIWDTYNVIVPYDEFYSVSGTVVEEDGGIPVNAFPIQLNSNYGSYIYQETVTDSNGRFNFPRVIPGKYFLSEDFKSLDGIEYVFSDTSDTTHCLFESSTSFNWIDLDVNEDIDDIKILVKPVVKTIFSGIVVDRDGIPTLNTQFTVDLKIRGRYVDKVKTYPEDFKTDSTGRFSLTIFSQERSENDRYDYVLTAFIGEILPPHIVQKPDGSGADLVKNKINSSSSGSLTVIGDMGDTFNDLNIMLKPYTTDKILHGRFVVEEQEAFSEVYINGYQNTRNILIQLNKEGYFKSENISTGDLTLEINPAIKVQVDTPNGPYEMNKYLRRIVNIEIDDENQDTYVEIPLQPSGYYWGYVKDDSSNPLLGAQVWAEDKSNSNGHPVYFTNKNGFFFIPMLKFEEGMKYNIRFRTENQDRIIPNIPINTGNLILAEIVE